jgi:hypothetical protein
MTTKFTRYSAYRESVYRVLRVSGLPCILSYRAYNLSYRAWILSYCACILSYRAMHVSYRIVYHVKNNVAGTVIKLEMKSAVVES